MGQNATVHCTITGQMLKQEGYLDEFLQFWTPRPEIRRVWFSLFTPQRGDEAPEILTADERQRAIADMLLLRKIYPKLEMPEAMIREFARPRRARANASLPRPRRRFRRTNEDHSLPVRRRSGLRLVRMRGVDGRGCDRESQARRRDSHWSDFSERFGSARRLRNPAAAAGPG